MTGKQVDEQQDDGRPDDPCWVRLSDRFTPDPSIAWRIDGNAHTHRGHFHVCSIGELDLHRSVNKADVVEASPEAAAWIAGFLAGQEATQFEFMGHSDDLLDAMDADDEARWKDWNARFRARGFAGDLAYLPGNGAELSLIVDPPAWVYIAGRYRIWRNDAWTGAAIQPAPVIGEPGWTWPGTPCEQREFHNMDNYGSFTICLDCHQVDASIRP